MGIENSVMGNEGSVMENESSVMENEGLVMENEGSEMGNLASTEILFSICIVINADAAPKGNRYPTGPLDRGTYQRRNFFVFSPFVLFHSPRIFRCKETLRQEGRGQDWERETRETHL